MSANASPAPPGTSSRRRWPVRLAAIGSALAAPVATWWLVGDQTDHTSAAKRMDYLVRPPEIAAPAERSLGLLAVAVFVAAMVVLVRASRRRDFDRRWWATLVPLLVVGLIVGSGWRMVTAGTVGANIGAGLTILFGGGLAALLSLWAIGWSARLLLRSRGRRCVPDGS